jgi:hypothetical protein
MLIWNMVVDLLFNELFLFLISFMIIVLKTLGSKSITSYVNPSDKIEIVK